MYNGEKKKKILKYPLKGKEMRILWFLSSKGINAAVKKTGLALYVSVQITLKSRVDFKREVQRQCTV